MHRLASHNKDEIIRHIAHIKEEYPTLSEMVLFKYSALPFLESLGGGKVPFKLFGTIEGISSQIDSFTHSIGLVHCFVDYVSKTDAYVIRSFPVCIKEDNNETR